MENCGKVKPSRDENCGNHGTVKPVQVMCGYRSKAGQSCKKMATTDKAYCPAHTCPRSKCGKVKSSKAQDCGTHTKASPRVSYMLSLMTGPNHWKKLTASDIKMGIKLGNGNFGEVYKGTIKATGQVVAIKTCKLTTEEAKKGFMEEADTLKLYDHPNIVQLVGTATATANLPAMIILELLSAELLDYLKEHRSEGVQVELFTQMCTDSAQGMAYLHEKLTVHRDLAARNCLISDKGVTKVSDFGLSRLTNDEEDIYTLNTTAKTLPIKWTAPEVLEYLQYGMPADVWSFGVLMWEIWSCGKFPYPGMNNRETRNQVVQLNYRMRPPRNTPAKIAAVMRSCWERQPQDRPKMKQLVGELTGTSGTARSGHQPNSRHKRGSAM